MTKMAARTRVPQENLARGEWNRVSWNTLAVSNAVNDKEMTEICRLLTCDPMTKMAARTRLPQANLAWVK
jgi:hypothetical protein